MAYQSASDEKFSPAASLEVRPSLSVVVPCFNEAEALRLFHSRMSQACQSAARPHEIILVDDGSSDGTWSIIKELSAQHESVVGVRLSRNHGHQLALTAGLDRARGERVLIIDADLQDPPELLPAMMAIMDCGADVVYGQRRRRHGESWFKKFTAHVFYRFLALLTDVRIPNDTGDFRLMSRRVLDVFKSMRETERFVRGMVSWTGFNQQPLLYDRDERVAGRSKYPLRKMMRFAANAVTSFSTKPLRLASYLGLTMGVFCLLAILYQVIAHYVGHTVPGWTSLIVVVLFVGALQLFVLGIIGEYLGRLFVESKHRPLYIVADSTEPN